MTRPARLAVTRLEDRTVPAGFGNAWIDTNLTASFVPDGTLVEGSQSSLFRTLGARMSTAEWQAAIKTAFQTWVAPANLNVGFVPDDGRAVGSAGPIQGSPAVGDVRISARPLSDNVLAISNPFDLISPVAGEIILNSNKVFDNDGSAGTCDLQRVLMQEVGHVLGVGNSTDPSSVMYENYGSPSMSPADVAAVQALYGPRTPDRYEGYRGNDAVDKATDLQFLASASQVAGIDPAADATRYVAEGDVRNATDADVYAVALPSGRATILVQTGGISQAKLRVAVLDATGKELAATTNLNATTGLYRLSYTPPAAGTFYVSVKAANGGALEVGSYRLAVGSGLTAVPASDLSTRVQSPYFGSDSAPDWANGAPANDTFDKAQRLSGDVGDANARWATTGYAGIDAAADVDVYAVSTKWNANRVLVVAVWSETNDPAPTVKVYDKDKRLVAAGELVRNDSGTILQVEGLQAWSTYYVKVQSASAAAWTKREAYRFGVDFRNEKIALQSLAEGQLTAAASQARRTLTVTRSQVFVFELSAVSVADTTATAGRMTIFNARGVPVFTTTATSGNTSRGMVLLAPGNYTVVISGATRDGRPLQGLRIDARFQALTDPIGPTLADDYSSATTGVTTAAPPPDTGYIWVTPPDFGIGFLAALDPYSSPWW